MAAVPLLGLLLGGHLGVIVQWNLGTGYETLTAAGLDVSGAIDGAGGNATFDKPFSVAIDHINQELFVADKGNHRIRRVRVGGLVSQASANGTQLAVNLDARNVQDYVTTLAGSTQGYADGFGTAAKFSMPSGLAVDGHTRLLFVADTANYAIRKIDLTNGRVTTLAGSAGMPGFVNGRGEAASFAFPIGLALAMHSRQLYVCDAHNHALRVVHVVLAAAGRVVAGCTRSEDGRRACTAWCDGG